ncbi:hypothetical protein HRH25_01385 [Flavisolibacter sp. BT320]|nr:hypothetical protein [Flavisolibacter longurius]
MTKFTPNQPKRQGLSLVTGGRNGICRNKGLKKFINKRGREDNDPTFVARQVCDRSGNSVQYAVSGRETGMPELEKYFVDAGKK